MKAIRRAPHSTKLALACAFICPVTFLLCRIVMPEYELSSLVAGKWRMLLLIEFLAVVPALVLLARVRAGRWLWFAWLAASIDYTVRQATIPSYTALSIVLTSIYVGWAVKLVIGIMLFLRKSEPSASHAEMPNKAPEPTSGSVTPRAKESASEMKRQNPNRQEARGAPAPVVAHL